MDQALVHFHVLLPEAVFAELPEDTPRLVPLPPPITAEAEQLATTVARRILARLCAL